VNPWVGLLVLALGGVILVTAVVWAAVRLAPRLFGGGGWTALAIRYPAPPADGAPEFVRITVQLGAVRYRRLVSAWVDDAGLRLVVRFPRRTAVKLPWQELHPIGPARIDLATPGHEIAVGAPVLAVLRLPAPLWQAVTDHLRGSPCG
jgi:hypothetical protein